MAMISHSLQIYTVASLLLLQLFSLTSASKTSIRIDQQQSEVLAPRSAWPECDVCEWLVAETEKYWSLNATQEEIIDMLSPFCTSVFSFIEEYCLFLLNEGVSRVVEYLEEELPPHWVCVDFFQVCPANVTLVIHALQGNNTSGTKEEPFSGTEVYFELECRSEPTVGFRDPYWYAWLEEDAFCGWTAQFQTPNSFQSWLRYPKVRQDGLAKLHITAGANSHGVNYQKKQTYWVRTDDPYFCPDE